MNADLTCYGHRSQRFLTSMQRLVSYIHTYIHYRHVFIIVSIRKYVLHFIYIYIYLHAKQYYIHTYILSQRFFSSKIHYSMHYLVRHAHTYIHTYISSYFRTEKQIFLECGSELQLITQLRAQVLALFLQRFGRFRSIF